MTVSGRTPEREGEKPSVVTGSTEVEVRMTLTDEAYRDREPALGLIRGALTFSYQDQHRDFQTSHFFATLEIHNENVVKECEDITLEVAVPYVLVANEWEVEVAKVVAIDEEDGDEI